MSEWRLGIQAFQKGRMREAADRLQEAVADHDLTITQSVQFENLAYLGAALYALGQAEEAIKAFETAFQFSPTPLPAPELTLNLVYAYLAAGRREASRETLSFLLDYAPGHIAGRMLLMRLDQTPAEEQPTGVILGNSPDSVKKYIRTLSFASVSTGGYDPAQVWEALSQLEYYLETLDARMQGDHVKMAQYESDLERYRQMEDTMVQNIVNQQQDSYRQLSETESPETPSLTPLELLFQKKP